MPMLDPQREIQALVDTFVADLSQLAKRIAIEQIKAAFELGAPPLPPYVAGSSFTLTSPPPAAPAARGRGRRAARDHRDVEGLRDKLVAVITEQPGPRTQNMHPALSPNTTQRATAL